MNFRSTHLAVFAAIALCMSLRALVVHASDPATVTQAAPLGLDVATLRSMVLEPRTPAPASVVLSGVSQPRSSVLFKSEAVVVVLYEERPLKLALRAPGMPYDEFVHVVVGSLILTDTNGQSREFVAGDSVLIPKGFVGTWEARGNFRELALVSRQDWDATH